MLYEVITNYSDFRIILFDDTISITETVPYSVYDSACDDDDSGIGNGLWCRATNTSDPSITVVVQAVV